MIDKNKRERIIILYILLFNSLILSQNIAWKLIRKIPNINEYILLKSTPIYQLGASAIYIFLSITTTDDNSVLHEILERNPKLNNFIEKYIYMSILTFSRIVTFLMYIPMIFDENEDQLPRLADKMKQDINAMTANFNSPIFEVRLFSGVLTTLFLIFLVSFFLPVEIISLIADLLSLFVNIIGGAFVANNVKLKVLNE